MRGWTYRIRDAAQRLAVRGALACIICPLIIGAGVWAAMAMNRQIDAALSERFNRRLEATRSGLESRLKDYELALRGVVGMFRTGGPLTRDNWEAYFQFLRFNDVLPGIQSMGYSHYVEAANKDAFVRRLRAEIGATYEVLPAGERPAYVPVVYIAPMNERTERAIGFDMYSESERRNALMHARDVADVTLTRKVTLVTEIEQQKQPGVLMYAPVFRYHGATSTVEERRTSLVGYVYGAFRTTELINAVLDSSASDFVVAVYDGTTQAQENLLYASADIATAGTGLSGTASISAADRTWTLVVRAKPAFTASEATVLPWLILGGSALLSLLVLAILRSGADQRRKALQLASVGQELEQTVGVLQDQTRELNDLRELSDVLQNCKVTSEAFGVVGRYMESAFPDSSGAIFLINNSRLMMDAGMTWGKMSEQSPDPFHPDDGWALRRSKLNLVERPDTLTQCDHAAEAGDAYLCIPMNNHGDAIGVVHFRPPANQGPAWLKRHGALASIVCEQVGVALGGLKLRDHLRHLSTRDPLTGLFNRRYLEETLDREERRATREGMPIGIIVLDLDHFKRANDTHGHDTGDHILCQVGAVLRNSVRESDIPCRYGGEEFVLALPGASLAITQMRAEKVRAALEHLSITTPRGAIVNVTGSLGVAVYPDNGATWREVVTAADRALYRAKSEGRNRVVTDADPAVRDVPERSVVEPALAC